MFKFLNRIFRLQDNEQVLRNAINRTLIRLRYETLDKLYGIKETFIGKESTEWAYYKEYWKLQGRLEVIDEIRNNKWNITE